MAGRYRDHAGEEHSKSFARERYAKVSEADQRRAVRRGEWVNPAHDKTTVTDALSRWAARPGLRDTSLTSCDTVAKNLGNLGVCRCGR